MPKHRRTTRHTNPLPPRYTRHGWDAPQAFWCELVAYRPHAPDRLYLLGSRTAASPRLAMRWLHWRALSMVAQLSTLSQQRIAAWTDSVPEYEVGMGRLAAGELYAFTWTDTDEYGETLCYLLTSRPMRPSQLLGSYHLADEQRAHVAQGRRFAAPCAA